MLVQEHFRCEIFLWYVLIQEPSLIAGWTTQPGFVWAGSMVKLLWSLYCSRIKHRACTLFFHTLLSLVRTDALLYWLCCWSCTSTTLKWKGQKVTVLRAIVPDLDVCLGHNFLKSLCNPKPLGIHFEKTECTPTVHVVEQRGQASADWYISPEQR